MSMPALGVYEARTNEKDLLVSHFRKHFMALQLEFVLGIALSFCGIISHMLHQGALPCASFRHRHYGADRAGDHLPATMVGRRDARTHTGLARTPPPRAPQPR
eukprot:4927334-Prymnesium_polylepis.1